MKNAKKLLAVLLVMMMTLALAVPVFAKPDPVAVNFSVKWVDNHNAAGKRTIPVVDCWRVVDGGEDKLIRSVSCDKLKIGEMTDEEWPSLKLENLPAGYTYYIAGSEIPHYKYSISGDFENGFVLTYTYYAPKITVKNTVKDKVYDIYKIFDLTGSDTDNPLDYEFDNFSYTIDPDWVEFFFGSADYPQDSMYLIKAGKGVEQGDLNALTYNNEIYYINITEDNIAQFAQTALAWCADNTPEADDTKVAEGDTLVFDELELGYYLVYPQGATDIKPGWASICSLTSTMPESEVVVKAEYPKIDKTVDDPSVEIGQVVTFTVTGKVPDTTGFSYYKYEVTDTMSSGLTFDDTVDNITVTFGDTPITVQGNAGVQVGTSYTVANNGFTLTFDMTKYQDYKEQSVTITYQAVINDDAVVTLTENKAKLEYSNDPEDTTKTDVTPEVEVQVYSSEIVIDKYDGADVSTETKLQGAEFVLVKITDDGEVFYKYSEATETDNAKVTWGTKEDATVVVTDADGVAKFKGLEDGTYYLREIKSPDGFNLLTEDVEVTVAHTMTDEDAKPIGVTVTSQVANNSGTVLPATGGMGTVLFIAIGAILLMTAGIVLTAKKRLYNEG